MCPLDVKRGEVLWVQGAPCSQARPPSLLTFSISYSVLPFHLVYVFQRLHLSLSLFLMFFLKSIKHCRKAFVYIFIGEGNGTPLQYSCLGNPGQGS